MLNWLRRIACLMCSYQDKYETVDRPSPRDLIAQEDITYVEDKRLVIISNIAPPVWLTTVADTNSMDPTVDAGHTCILTKHFKYEDLAVGDVVVYQLYTRFIMHRIIKISEDEYGRIYTLKGDNCYRADPYPVRDIQIKWLLLGILY